MKDIVFPSLSEKGWVTDTVTVLAKLLTCYILTDAGQSLAFQNRLINLPETYFKHFNSPEGMKAAIKEDLNKLLERYYETVEVVTEVSPKEETRVAILIYAYVVDNKGVKVSMGKVLEMDNEGLKKTVDINNVGDGYSLL